MSAEYRVTFGQQYPREPHPVFPEAHRDGYVTIEAPGTDEARAIAFATLGTAWCDIYSPESWREVAHYFPVGELMRFVWPDDLSPLSASKPHPDDEHGEQQQADG